MTKNRRRAKGTGSIYTRKDGRVVGEYEVNGRTKYIYGRVEDTVKEKLAAAIRDRDAGFDDENLTVGEYLDRWLANIKNTLRPGSFTRYEASVRLHINPTLGKVRLRGLKPQQLQALYGSKLGEGLSPRTVQIIHATMHKALKQAVKWRLIPYNVAEAAEKPRAPRTEIQPLDSEQVKRLLMAAAATDLYVLYVLAITTGMRQGELLGLQWADVDLDAGILHVRRSSSNGYLHAPKTSKSRRSIKLPHVAAEALRRHPRGSTDPSRDQQQWIFGTSVGTPIITQNFYNRSWRPLVHAAGLPSNTRFHDLRHTCASLLLSKGVHPKLVQELLGHASIEITLDTYSHVLPSMGNAAADGMDDILG